MTNTTDWPNPEFPGFPMFPERDGWHWLSNSPNGVPFPAEWRHEDYCDAETEWFWDMGEEWEDAHEMRGLYYRGPCLTPTQIADMLAAAREQFISEALPKILVGLAELPDRTSPDDAPEMLMATAHEIEQVMSNKIRYLGAEP